MSKRSELTEQNYRVITSELWCSAWDYTCWGKCVPAKDGFRKYMDVLVRHINMLEARIEELENTSFEIIGNDIIKKKNNGPKAS